MQKPSKSITKEDALVRLKKYCSYQERCHLEVRYKLVNIGIRGNDLENIMSSLIEEDYLDEERFALSYARGKFRNKQWGKSKIRQELVKRKIGDYLCKKALQQIDPEDYRATLQTLLARKRASLKKNLTTAEVNLRLFKYVYQKGYEPDLIYKMLAAGDEMENFMDS